MSLSAGGVRTAVPAGLLVPALERFERRRHGRLLEEIARVGVLSVVVVLGTTRDGPQDLAEPPDGAGAILARPGVDAPVEEGHLAGLVDRRRDVDGRRRPEQAQRRLSRRPLQLALEAFPLLGARPLHLLLVLGRD